MDRISRPLKKLFSIIQNDTVTILVFSGIGLTVFFKFKTLDLQSPGDVVLFITFLGLVWYSNETRKSRINSEEQTNLLLTPVVELSIEENEAAAYRFKLKNVGAGLALNVQISKNTVICRNNIYMTENKEMYKVPEFEVPNFLYPGQEEILKPKQKGEDILWLIKPSNVENPGYIKVKCQNLKGKEFVYRFEIRKRCSDGKGWTYYEAKVVLSM